MLVLTRKVGDVIAIGDNIKIVVMAIKGKQVRLGVQADRNTIVHREEVYQKIQREIKAAMQSEMHDAIAADSLLKTATEAASVENSGLRAVKTQKPTHCVIRKSSSLPEPTEDEDFEEDEPPPKKAKSSR